MSRSPLQQPPTHPHRWLVWFIASQCAVALVWWWLGWRIGLPLLVASHVPFLWGVLWPYSRFYGPVLTRLPGDAPEVWLTIDDGPSADTLPMLDLLDQHGARATFFLVAQRAAERPELVREIVRRGHEIGNHSDSHPEKWFWALGPQAMRRQILDAQARLTALAGAPPRWFRAVVGMANPFVQAPLRDAGLTRVAWNARGFDGLDRPVEDVMRALQAGLKPAAIVLLHEGGDGRHIEILRRVLALLEARGLRAVLPP